MQITPATLFYSVLVIHVICTFNWNNSTLFMQAIPKTKLVLLAYNTYMLLINIILYLFLSLHYKDTLK